MVNIDRRNALKLAGCGLAAAIWPVPSAQAAATPKVEGWYGFAEVGYPVLDQKSTPPDIEVEMTLLYGVYQNDMYYALIFNDKHQTGPIFSRTEWHSVLDDVIKNPKSLYDIEIPLDILAEKAACFAHLKIQPEFCQTSDILAKRIVDLTGLRYCSVLPDGSSIDMTPDFSMLLWYKVLNPEEMALSTNIVILDSHADHKRIFTPKISWTNILN